MKFDNKIAVVVQIDLASWQKLNVTAFLASAIAGASPETIGEPYRDGSGAAYLPIFRQPVLVLAGPADTVAAAFHKARCRDDLRLALYVEAMFETGHDAANRATIADVPSDALAPVGFSVYGPKNAVDRALKGLSLHP